MSLTYALLLSLILMTSCNESDKKSSVSEQGIFPKSQVSDYLRCIYEDRNGNLWFGTTRDGVCRYNPSAAKAMGVLSYFSKKEGLAGMCVKDIAEDKAGNLWFATEGGVTKFDGKYFTSFTVKDGLNNNDVWSILVDRNGTFWFGTMTGVSCYDGRHFKDFALPVSGAGAGADNSSRMALNQVLSMCEDQAGDLWFGTGGAGVIRYNRSLAVAASPGRFTTYTEKDGLAGNKVWCIAEDKNGNIWFGTRGGGASRYNPAAANSGSVPFTNYTQKVGLAGNNVGAIVHDRAGNTWFGTSGGGASRFDGKTFKTYTENEGLTQNHIQSIYEDKAGNLWFGLSGGLFRFDGKAFINITKDGPWL